MAAHLVLIPTPGAGHLFSAIELAKLLVDRDRRLSVSILIMTFPDGTKPESFASSLEPLEGITFVHLSHRGYAPETKKTQWMALIDFHKPQIRDFLAEWIRSESTRLAGVVLDMFCAALIDVVAEIGVPSYIFFVCGAGFLGLAMHALDQDLTPFKDSDADLVIPGFVNSVPAQVLPTALTHSEFSRMFLSLVAKFKSTKGILVNTFLDLQSHPIAYLSEKNTIPPIYPVGPMTNLKGGSNDSKSESIITWLDSQPKSSVVFLCFGSTGTFDAEQVMEIARALENSGTRFLWSLRRPPLKGPSSFPIDYDDMAEALPKGFLERTAETGKVIGWAPQTTVLSHPAVGGFVSHCGWNSSLESIWFGVPIATWPLSADQQINAFELVKELGIAVDLKLDFKKDFESEANYLINAEEIEKAINQLIDVSKTDDSMIKQKLKDMSKKSRMAMAEGGSSYAYLDRFIEAVIGGTDSKK